MFRVSSALQSTRPIPLAAKQLALTSDRHAFPIDGFARRKPQRLTQGCGVEFTGVTRIKAKRSAQVLGVDERRSFIWHLTHELGTKVLPEYEAGDAGPTKMQFSQIKRAAPKTDVKSGQVRYSPFCNVSD